MRILILGAGKMGSFFTDILSFQHETAVFDVNPHQLRFVYNTYRFTTLEECLLINKIDVLPYFDFDLEECKKRVLKLNPDMKIIPISARTGEGMDEWIDWLKEETSSWNESNEKGVNE